MFKLVAGGGQQVGLLVLGEIGGCEYSKEEVVNYETAVAVE